MKKKNLFALLMVLVPGLAFASSPDDIGHGSVDPDEPKETASGNEGDARLLRELLELFGFGEDRDEA